MKIVFLGIPAHGHVNPSLPILTELVRRGHDVTAFNSPQFEEKLARTGAKFATYDTPEESDDIQEVANFMYILWKLTTIGEKIINRQLQTIIDLQPDLILHDSMASWGKYIGHITQIPAISLCTTFAFDPEKRHVPSWRLIGSFMYDVFTNWSLYKQTEDIVWRSAAKYKFKPHVVGELLNNHERLNIVFTSRDIQPKADKLAPHPKYQFVGCSIAERADKIDFEWDKSLDNQPIIYISLGTLMARDARFFNEAMTAFAEMKYRVLISIGKFVDEKDLIAIPENCIIRRFVPQLEVLKMCAVFITHGGLNSLHEGVYFGVPMLIVPQQPEQRYNGEHFANTLKTGILLPKPTGNLLLTHTETLLTDSQYRENAQRLSVKLREAGGFKAAADIIESYTL
jgi:MGT family glycosyltransferase